VGKMTDYFVIHPKHGLIENLSYIRSFIKKANGR